MANIALKVGIDVSKSKFDVCYRSGNVTVSKTYSSGARSVKEFVSSLPEGSHCVMEATGVYHTRLAYALHEAGIIVSVVNPLVIKNFSRMRMARTKTDRADAELIMEYAEREDPPAWEPAEAECIKAHNCLVTIDLYQRQITAMRNEVEALEQSAVCDGKVMNSLKKSAQSLEKEIAKLEEEMLGLVKAFAPKQAEELQSIPGIGKKTAATLITATKGMRGFSNYRQLSSYFGLCPRIYASGTSVRGKARICKMGQARMRQMLYVCAWSAMRYNKPCAQMAERLYEVGKPKKLILVAVANKLLKQSFAIIKNDTYYNDNYKSTLAN